MSIRSLGSLKDPQAHATISPEDAAFITKEAKKLKPRNFDPNKIVDLIIDRLDVESRGEVPEPRGEGAFNKWLNDEVHFVLVSVYGEDLVGNLRHALYTEIRPKVIVAMTRMAVFKLEEWNGNTRPRGIDSGNIRGNTKPFMPMDTVG